MVLLCPLHIWKKVESIMLWLPIYIKLSEINGAASSLSNFGPMLSEGAQWLSGRVLDSRPMGRRHCVVVLEQDTFILA